MSYKTSIEVLDQIFALECVRKIRSRCFFTGAPTDRTSINGTEGVDATVPRESAPGRSMRLGATGRGLRWLAFVHVLARLLTISR